MSVIYSPAEQEAHAIAIAENAALRAGIERKRSGPATVQLPLDSFVEKTTRHTLDSWQHHLCDTLTSLADSKGRRLLIAAPPQGGKSIIVSQRFPAWLIAKKPTHRVKLACYNITHALRKHALTDHCADVRAVSIRQGWIVAFVCHSVST